MGREQLGKHQELIEYVREKLQNSSKHYSQARCISIYNRKFIWRGVVVAARQVEGTDSEGGSSGLKNIESRSKVSVKIHKIRGSIVVEDGGVRFAIEVLFGVMSSSPSEESV